MSTSTSGKLMFWQEQSQKKTPIITAALVIIGLVMCVIRYIMDGHFSDLLLVQIATTIICIITVILYRTRYRDYAIHLLLATGIISIFATGGLDSPGLVWLTFVPLLAAFLANNLSSILYTLATLIGLVFLWFKADALEFSHFSLGLAIVFGCGFAVWLESIRRKYESTILELATSNPVTDLPSRAVFDALLKRVTGLLERDGALFVLVFIDVNGLKRVNDTFGHPAGDELLKEVGRRLNKTVRRSESLFHISGDEFVIIAEDTPNLEELKTRIRGIGGDFIYNDFRIPLSISVGATSGTVDSKATLAAADNDMYSDKRSYRNSAA